MVAFVFGFFGCVDVMDCFKGIRIRDKAFGKVQGDRLFPSSPTSVNCRDCSQMFSLCLCVPEVSMFPYEDNFGSVMFSFKNNL
ncbi:MAG: hypothetical protein IJ599_00305 [Alphaproteobacteria bacterium]|nr:hypothetical protein [Alphaproteobacteria bacterium]